MPIPQDYKTVPERIADFKAKHPEGSLQPLDLAKPYEVIQCGDKTFVVYCSAAYRTPDDPRPGIGIAWELFPGPTNFTRDSELMNAETSSWGRAIVAALASESKSVASHEDVRNRDYENAPPPSARPSSTRECVVCHQDLAGAKAKKHGQGWVHDPLCEKPADDPNQEPF